MEIQHGDVCRQGLCHCTHCRKMCSSAFLTFLTVPQSNLRFTSATPKTYSFDHKAGPRIHVSFCGECGTGVSKAMEGDGRAIIFAGTIDDDGKTMATKPQGEIWTKDRLDWCGRVGKGAMAEFEEFPPAEGA